MILLAIFLTSCTTIFGIGSVIINTERKNQ